jgi:Ulp1 family protease
MKQNIDWKLCYAPTPQQSNVYDCGVFTMMIADFITDGLTVDENSFSAKNISFFRKKICADIARGYINY